MKLIAILIILLCGIGSSSQTAINSRLREHVKGPFLATTISFVVGWAVLLAITLATRHTLSVPAGSTAGLPFWAWLGGAVGVYCIAANVFLFPKLGSIKVTITMTLGQILIGMLIDQFGWFESTRVPLTATRIAGAAIVLAGLFVYVSGKKEKTEGHPGIGWYILGLSVGAGFSIQAAMNGLLSVTLDSSVLAALISFSSALLILFAIVLGISSERRLIRKAFNCGSPTWTYFGGVFGALYVAMFAWLIPVLGVGAASVISVLGMLLMSLFIDMFGIFGAEKTKIGKAQFIGLAVIAIGVVVVNL